MILVIFELFDFNEIESLSITDFEYLLECCIISSCKMHNLTFDYEDLTELGVYLAQTFDEDKRISFQQVLKYCATDQFIGNFMKLFKIPDIDRKFVNRIDNLLASAAENLLDPDNAQSCLCTCN